MRELFITLSILLFLSSSLFGQIEAKGTVVNQDGKVLTGATIKEKGTNQGTITGIDGMFKLITHADSLEISYIGHTSKIIASNIEESIKIVLVEKFQMSYDYQPVGIYAQNILTENENITTLPKNIKELTIPGNTNDILNNIAGLHMQSGGLNTNKLSIRGIGGTSQFATFGVKTFYNNIPMHSSIGESAIEDLGLHMAERIEVIKGTTGSEFESGYGGAILLKNKNINPEEKTEFFTKNTIGQWGHFTSQNQISIGRTNMINSHNFAVYHSIVTDDGYRENNQFDRNNLTVNYTTNRKGKLKVTALLNRVDLKAFIPSSLNRTDYDDNPSIAAFTWNNSKGNESYNRTLLGLNVDHTFDFKRSMSHTAYGQFFKSTELRPFNTIDESNSNFGIKGNFKYNRSGYDEVYTIGYRVQKEAYDFQLFETNVDMKGSQFNNGNEERSIYELYAQLQAEINEKWSYRLSLNSQYANISADSNTILNKAFILPDATFTFNINNKNRIYINIGRGINYFSPQEALLPNGQYSQTLIPSSAWNISLGSKGKLTDKLQYRSEVYHMWISDLITTDRNETNQAINTNGGNANYSGLEIALKYDLIKNHNTSEITWKKSSQRTLSIDLQYALMNNRYRNFINDEFDYSDNIIPGTPTQTISSIITGEYMGWFTNFRYQFVKGYHMRNDNSIKSDSYQLVHAMAGYRWTIGICQISPRVDIINAFDQKHASMTLANASSFGGNPPRYYYTGRPRNMMVSLNLKFSL